MLMGNLDEWQSNIRRVCQACQANGQGTSTIYGLER